MESIILVIPDITFKEEAINFIEEFKEFNSNINGTGGLDRYLENYDNWLKKLDRDLDYENIKPDRVPANTYFAITENYRKIIGMINIRHRLNNHLIEKGGHIGFGVRLKEIRKGYATKILSLGLTRCKELKIQSVLITCDKDNVASAKTIQKNGGIMENEIYDKDTNKIIQRYWIKI